MLTAYLAGPMRGRPKFNFPAFFEAAGQLRMLGFEVINPAQIDADHYGFRYWDPDAKPEPEATYMRRDLRLVTECDLLVLLPGWSGSSGAQKEIAVAQWCGIPVIPFQCQKVLTLLSLKGSMLGVPATDWFYVRDTHKEIP